MFICRRDIFILLITMTLRSREVFLRYNSYAMKTNMENISVNKLNINDLIERAQSKTLDEQYWKKLEKDMKQFLSEDHPESEKGILAPLGLLESVSMIAAGLEYERLHGNSK